MRADALHPMTLAGLGFETTGDAAVGDDEEESAFSAGAIFAGPTVGHNRRGHVGAAFFGSPGNFFVADFAPSVGLDGQDVPSGKAGGDEDVFAVVDGRGHELLGGPVHDPVPAAVGRVVAGHAEAAAEDHLHTAVDLADQRRAIAAGVVRPGRFPDGFARGAIERHQVAVAVVVAVEDEEIFVNQGAGAESMHGTELAGPCLPLAVAGEVVGGHVHASAGRGLRGGRFFGVQKGHVDQPPVGQRRARGMAVEPVFLFQGCPQHRAPPKDFAATAVDAQQQSLAGVALGRNDEDAIFPDDGRAVAGAGDGRFPGDVTALGVPVRGNAGFPTAAVAAGSAPAGPVFGPRGDGRDEQLDEK